MSALPALAAVGAGVASHLLYFKRGEHHNSGIRYMQATFTVCALTVVARTRLEGVSTSLALVSTITFAILYFTGVFSSLLFWRLFLNPLNKIPGPYAARITKFHHVFSNAKLDRHHQLKKLHEKYGKFVRLGPNDISVTDPRGIAVISGGQSKCTKGPWYDADHPKTSVHTTRSRADHDRRRRVWSPAFSDKALRGYEVRIQRYNDLLLQQVEARVGQPMNMSQWFNLYSFDVMGDLGFGASFDSIQDGKMHWAIELLTEGMKPSGFGMPEWLFRVLIAVPGLAGGYHRFVNYCCQRLDDRMKKQGKSDNPDIAHILIDDFEKNAKDKNLALELLQADTRLIIVAGSDTTAATLVHLFLNLAKYPEEQEKIRKEIRSLCQGGKIDHHGLQDATLLNGAIHEALRLNPPVPSGLYRKTPNEGVMIGNTFVAGDTTIQMPQYVMGHDEDIYTDCEKFIPERWSSKPEMIKNKDAFSPFSVGPYNCIGKNVAYMELRTLTSQLLDRYDVTLAPGEDGAKLLSKTLDHFTLGLAPLDLVFTKRLA